MRRDVLLIADPYVLPVTMFGCCAFLTGMCLLDGSAGFWGCVIAGIFFGSILSLPMVILVAVALWVVDQVIDVVEAIRDEIRWRRAKSQAGSEPWISPGYGFAIGLYLCLWAGLAILTWDADAVFVSVVASFLATCILVLPVAFAAWLFWRIRAVLAHRRDGMGRGDLDP